MKHAFVICAYKKSDYLEKCIRSLIHQTVKSKILICTSTPNEYIYGLAKKYHIDVSVRKGISDIQDDWNYGINSVDAEWVTVAHQDDVYDRHYTEYILKAVSRYPNSLIAFTDYMPIHDYKVKNDINAILRRVLRTPMKYSFLSDNAFFKKYFLSLGNAICCPSVTYHKAMIDGDIFTSKLKFSLDWDTFVKLSKMDGRFLYVDKPLTFYRIHKEATTAYFVDNRLREKEDAYMFSQFWPPIICKIIMLFYKKAYDNYKFD